MQTFRELISYCITAISPSGFYSLALQQTPTASFLILSFWSENVFHRICLGSALRGMLLPRKVLSLVSSFLSLFDVVASCLDLVNLGDKLGDFLSTCLPGKQPPTVLRPFGPEEFEKSLALPTSQIIERLDYRNILDFLLIKLRTALEKDWLQIIPSLYKINFLLVSYSETLVFLV